MVMGGRAELGGKGRLGWVVLTRTWECFWDSVVVGIVDLVHRGIGMKSWAEGEMAESDIKFL